MHFLIIDDGFKIFAFFYIFILPFGRVLSFLVEIERERTKIGLDQNCIVSQSNTLYHLYTLYLLLVIKVIVFSTYYNPYLPS